MLVLLCVFCCGCNVSYVPGEKKSTLFSYEKNNMVDDLTSDEQKKIIDALELTVPEDTCLSVRFITFYSYKDGSISYYRVELDGIEDYEDFFESNNEQRKSGDLAIDGYAQTLYGPEEYYLSVMVSVMDFMAEEPERYKKLGSIYEEIKSVRN